MIYAQNVFMRVLAGLSQQGVIGSEKRKLMISDFMKAKTSHEAETCINLLNELLAYTENRIWTEDLNKAIESLSY